jgi:eukaryotic-like serine/threonine-protein kinase
MIHENNDPERARNGASANIAADSARQRFDDFCQRLGEGQSTGLRQRPVQDPALAALLSEQDFQSLRTGPSISAVSTRLPSVHEELFGFRLLHELGHGAFARVFLAEQADLAGRPVVLKVSGIVGNEPQTLAQLQHAHIVPIHSLHEDKKAGLRAVCMPYFGGATLSQVLHTLQAGVIPKRGEQLVQALRTHPSHTVAAPGCATALPAAGPLALLSTLSYPRAAAWITARLAEGLAHAHQRGFYHRDIKPSNILLAADGQPMLLDFNLAHNIHDSCTQATLGGTVMYMAPEHLRALASPDPALGGAVDQRADIYSLGMVLHEMLVGHRPFQQSASYAPVRELLDAMAAERSRGLPTDRRLSSMVAPSLESIVRKCLAPDPAERYQHADELAEDLRRFLADRPLRFAAERSWRERTAKWWRRHPRLTSTGSVALIAAALLTASVSTAVQVSAHLQTSQNRERAQAFKAKATSTMCVLHTTSDRHDHLAKGIGLAEEALQLYEVLDRDAWQQAPAWQQLEPEERLRLGEDVREILMLLGRARVSRSPNDRGEVDRALQLLNRAETITDLPAAGSIWRYRELYHDLLHEGADARAAAARASEIPIVTARDHLFLAQTHALTKTHAGYTKAIAALQRALQLEPRHYWCLMLRGTCYRDSGELALAISDFAAGIGLAPELAWGYYHRGCVLDQLGKTAAAIEDYSAALERDPDLIDAYIQRGMARRQQRQYADARADFTSARQRGCEDASVYAGLGMACESLGHHAAADEAFAAALQRTPAASAGTQQRIRLGYAFAVAARLPQKAHELFASVLKEEPDQPQALYGQGMLLVSQPALGELDLDTGTRLERAVQLFERALAAQPGFAEARRFRAVLQARRGQWAAAFRDIEQCLSATPEDGATLYAAACVAALAAADEGTGERHAAQAIRCLEKALNHGYGHDKFVLDPDLAGVRHRPEFARLMALYQRSRPAT